MVAPAGIVASAPAKLILFGEHAVNRGQAAIAVGAGLYAKCTVEPGENQGIHLRSGERARLCSPDQIAALAAHVDSMVAAGDGAGVRRLLDLDWWAPVQYVLAGFGDALPTRLRLCWDSRIPASGGLGSGAACFVSMVAAIDSLLGGGLTLQQLAALARRGDVLAHGGIASGLDTSTSLWGGAIRFLGDQATPIQCAPGLVLVIGDTGVHAPTAAVNGRVRAWLAERASRMHYFGEIGTLARLAEPLLQTGDWPTLGHLLNLNQLLLERIGVSSPELERLCQAALEAGAYGAKLSGSGGGGIMLALAQAGSVAAIAAAIEQAGGRALAVPVAVPGVRLIDAAATISKEASC